MPQKMGRLPMPIVYTVYGVYEGSRRGTTARSYGAHLRAGEGPEIIYIGLTPGHVFLPLSKHIHGERTAELKAIDKYRPKYNITGNHGADWRVSA